MIDLKNVLVVDVSNEFKVLVPPTWSVVQSSEHYGRDIRDLENECAAELGINWPVLFGDEIQGEYEIERDAANVAVAMMRKRPDLQLWVKCSEPEWRPMYSPLAHIEATAVITPEPRK